MPPLVKKKEKEKEGRGDGGEEKKEEKKGWLISPLFEFEKKSIIKGQVWGKIENVLAGYTSAMNVGPFSKQRGLQAESWKSRFQFMNGLKTRAPVELKFSESQKTN